MDAFERLKLHGSVVVVVVVVVVVAVWLFLASSVHLPICLPLHLEDDDPPRSLLEDRTLRNCSAPHPHYYGVLELKLLE